MTVLSAIPGSTHTTTSTERPPIVIDALRPAGDFWMYMLSGSDLLYFSGSRPSFSAVIGLSRAGLSQTTRDPACGSSWSHALFVNRPSAIGPTWKTASRLLSVGAGPSLSLATSPATRP